MQRVATRMLQRLRGSQHANEFRLGILASGGGQAGVFGAGVVCALKFLGITSDMFNVATGISAGACNLLYYCAGNPEEGSTIYWENNCENGFIRLWRFWRPVNIRYLENVMRYVKPPISQNLSLKAQNFFCRDY